MAMRFRAVCAALAVLGLTGVHALAQDRPATPRNQGPAALARPKANPIVSENSKARTDENERQKRWDERMRRTTRSMCTGC
jgi:hypothetical protein